VLAPDEHEGRDEPEKGEEVRRGGDGRGCHRSRNIEVTDSNASANDPARSSGTRNSRSLAAAVSITARSPARAASLAPRTIAPTTRAVMVVWVGTPHGKKRFASMDMKRKSFMAAAHSMRARSG